MEEKETQNVSANILQTLQKDIAEIKLALLGNEYNPTAGLVHRMAEVEREHAKLKNRLDQIIWTASGVAIVLSFLFNLFMIWFNNNVLK